MPHFAFIGFDGPDGQSIRAQVREQHRVYLREAQPGCRAVLGGPLLDEAGEWMTGTLIVYEADDRAAVERFVAGDPYSQAGLFAETHIRPWAWGLGKP